MKFSVILAAAGRSSRFKDVHYKKPFAILNQKAVWLYSAELFMKRSDVTQIIIVVSQDDHEDFVTKFGPNLAVLGIDVAIGGAERSDSVLSALEKVDAEADFVAIHDAARPCIDDEMIGRIFAAAVKSKAAIPAIPVNSTVKRSGDGQTIDETVDRTGLYLAQTPQVFERKLLEEMYANRGTLQPTDEAQLAESQGHPVAIVKGSPLNIKITTKSDLSFAKACLKAMPKPKLNTPSHPFGDDQLWR